MKTLLAVFIGVISFSPFLLADPPKEGLVAHWPMNNDSSSIKDVSGNDHHAKGENLKEREGRGVRVLYFDGAKSRITVPDKPEFRPEGSFAMSFWVRPDAGDDLNYVIYNVPTAMSVSIFHSKLRVTFRNESYPNTGYADLMGGPLLNDGEWHHVVVSYDVKKGVIEGFVDGKEAANNKLPFPPVSLEPAPVTIGVAGRNFYKGEMSDFRLYNRELDLKDARALFKTPPGE